AQGLHDRMVRLMRLQQATPLPRRPPGATRDLVQELESPFGRPGIAIGEPEVGVDDTNQVELWKMVALGDNLGSDDDIDMAIRDGLELLAHALDVGYEIAGQDQQAGAGKQAGNLFLKPLHSWTAGDERLRRGAMRTGVGRRHRKAAVVADEPAPEATGDPPGAAVRAGKAVAPRAAQRQRGIAAPIEEQQRLLVVVERKPDVGGKPGRDEASARRSFAREIDGLDGRQALAAEPLRQMQPAIPPAPGIDLGLDR